MSVLLGHAKAFRALANAYEATVSDAGDGATKHMLWMHCKAYERAADRLEEMARAEASGPSFEDRPEQGRRP